MRSLIITIFLILFIVLTFNHFAKEDNFSKLTGPYLGQKPPGMTPEIFAPGIVTTSSNEAYPSFTKDGKEFYFKCSDRGGWLYTHVVSGKWSCPRIVPFSREYKFGEAMITSDGNTLLFCSLLDQRGSGFSENYNLWLMQKNKGKWQKPRKLGIKINTVYHEAYLSISASGDLYFFREMEEENGGCEIFVAENRNDQYLTPKNLGPSINSPKHDCDPYLAPDELYLVFCVRDRDEGFGKNDLYISFKNPDGSWSKSTNMGKKFNTNAEEITPYITPDGNYIFFSSKRTGNYDIYWVDAKTIEDLKPKELK